MPGVILFSMACAGGSLTSGGHPGVSGSPRRWLWALSWVARCGRLVAEGFRALLDYRYRRGHEWVNCAEIREHTYLIQCEREGAVLLEGAAVPLA